MTALNLPWRIEPAIRGPGPDEHEYTFVVDKDGIVVADCSIVGRSLAGNEARARFIRDQANAYHEVSTRALASVPHEGGGS